MDNPSQGRNALKLETLKLYYKVWSGYTKFLRN